FFFRHPRHTVHRTRGLLLNTSRIRRYSYWGGAALMSVIAYQLLLYPFFVERALVWSVARFTEGKLKLKVRRASLLFGFRFTDVELTDGKTGDPIFQAD